MWMITISPGHWRIGSGAKDIIDEVVQARRVVDRVVEILKLHNVPTTKIEDNVSQNQIFAISFGNTTPHKER